MDAQSRRLRKLLAAVLCSAALALAGAPGALAQPTGGAADLVMGAIGLVGVPYRFGGDDPASGLDCSGLVRFVVRNALGVQMPRRAEAMAQMGSDVDRRELQPGDLVFFDTLGRPFSHVGVYLGADQFVHAPARRGQVRIEDMAQGYWRTRFDGARRLAVPVPEAAAVDVAATREVAPFVSEDAYDPIKP